jgi:hypothetical protein
LANVGGGTPDPSELPGLLSVNPDHADMIENLADGDLPTPSVPPATDAARLRPLADYLD